MTDVGTLATAERYLKRHQRGGPPVQLAVVRDIYRHSRPIEVTLGLNPTIPIEADRPTKNGLGYTLYQQSPRRLLIQVDAVVVEAQATCPGIDPAVQAG
jgi:hypothetical protein